MRKTLQTALLGITCCASGIALFVSMPLPSLAGGPYPLLFDERTVFPTWHLGRKTKFCVRNSDEQDSGKVQVQALLTLAGPEEVKVGPKATNCIDREWAGYEIEVRNTGTPPVTVWTE